MKIFCNKCSFSKEGNSRKELIRILGAHCISKHGMKAGVTKVKTSGNKVDFEQLIVN